MREELYISGTPINEECVQLGSKNYDYHVFARIEGNTYIKQLKRMFPHDKINIRMKSEGHDFGTYYSMVINFDDNDQDAWDQAYAIEANEPMNWDEEAKEELKAAKYPLPLD